MENTDLERRRGFLKLALGIAAGVGVLAVTANSTMAAPLMSPADLKGPTPGSREADVAAKPAVANEQDIDAAQVEQVRYGYRRRGWRRGWAPRRRYFRRRYFRRRRYFY